MYNCSFNATACGKVENEKSCLVAVFAGLLQTIYRKKEWMWTTFTSRAELCNLGDSRAKLSIARCHTTLRKCATSRGLLIRQELSSGSFLPRFLQYPRGHGMNVTFGKLLLKNIKNFNALKRPTMCTFYPEGNVGRHV